MGYKDVDGHDVDGNGRRLGSPGGESPSVERRVNALGFINAKAVHEVVKYLARLCDGAQSLDGQGFNKQDSFNGHAWARQTRLTDEMAEQCRDMVRKYRRQIPDEMWRAMWR